MALTPSLPSPHARPAGTRKGLEDATYEMKVKGNFKPLVFRPSYCDKYDPSLFDSEKDSEPPTTMLAYVYAGAEVKNINPTRLWRVVRPKVRLFQNLDFMLVTRRCHPTDFMRAQFKAWRGGFNCKKRGKWIELPYPPPAFMCPTYTTEAGIEASMGWQRAWAIYEEYAKERLPYGAKYRDPKKLLDLDVKTARVRSAKLRRDQEGEMPQLMLSSFATAANIRRAHFEAVRKGERTIRSYTESADRYEQWDWRVVALVEYTGLVPRKLRKGDDRRSRLIRHAHAFLKTEQPTRDWLRRTLHPLKLPSCPSKDSVTRINGSSSSTTKPQG